MARKPRIHFPGALYHVIARGNRGEQIFCDAKDYELYLRFLSEYKERDQIYLYAYTLMPNHVHLLIEVTESPLSRLMQSLQFRYTRNFNIKYKKWGHLFQGRYKAILCEKESYFWELSAYIHLNAVRAGLVKDPGEYRWSSYRSYVTGGNKGLVDVDFLLVQLSNKKAGARTVYADFVKGRISEGHRDDFYELKDQCFLGTEDFVEDINRSIGEGCSIFSDIPLKEISSAVSSVLSIPTDLLYSQSRNRQGAWARSVAGYVARRLGSYQIKTIAEHFGRDPAAISQGVKRLEQRLRQDKAIAKALTRIEDILTRQSDQGILK